MLAASFAPAQSPDPVDPITKSRSDADGEFQRGLSLAKSGNPDDARNIFINAKRRFPSDKRFPIELAGLAFRSKNYDEAIRNLRLALRLDPKDDYANNFLASIYLLEGNLDAALRYWSRVGKPHVSEIQFEPTPSLDPVLLDRTFTITPASRLDFDDYKTTQARVYALGVFSPISYSLQPKPDGSFYLIVRAQERSGFGRTKLEAALRLLRGLPYQTVYPEYFNAGGRAINITSMLRWDRNKRRVGTAISAPLKSHPDLHYRIFADLRDENWVLSPETPAALPFPSRQYSFGAVMEQVVSGKWNWKSGAALVHLSTALPYTEETSTRGYSLQYFAEFERKLLEVPEQRLSLAANVTPTIGRNLGETGSSFARLQAAADLTWFPGRKLGDYEFTTRFSGGRSWGTLPFSSFFIVGTERDNDLLLRGHIGTRDGRKGSAPLARDYLLSNIAFTRRVFNNGFVDLKLGPFLDIARPYRTLQGQSSERWLFDPGIAFKVRVLGATTFTFSYGRNLHEGRNAFYVSALQ